MVKAPIKATKKTTKATTPKKKASKAPAKPTFDKEAFVFNTDTDVVVEAMKRLYAIDEDVNEYPFTDEELYWLGYWEMIMPKVLEMKINKLPLCAKECRVLGIYRNELVDLNRKKDDDIQPW